MVWINHDHHNYPAPPGTYGGAMCMCAECMKKRKTDEDNTRHASDASAPRRVTLKGCPMCGQDSIVIEQVTCSGGFYVECCDCGLKTAAWPTEKEAIAKWNKRFLDGPCHDVDEFYRE